jgi:integrase
MEVKQAYKVGEYYLTKNRAGRWCRSWYDQSAQQTKSSSLGTTSFEAAKQKLDAWFIENHKPVLDDDLELARCFLEYNQQHASYLKRSKAEASNMVFWLEYFPEKLIREIRPAQQREFIKYLVDQGYSENTIKGIFKTGSAAINFAWRNDMLLQQLPLLSPTKELSKYTFAEKKRWRALELSEIASMIEHSTSDYLIRYIILMIGCTCRPAAAIELEGNQVDLQAGTINLLKKGTKQNNKYRPTIKLPGFIRLMYHDENICYERPITLSSSRQVDTLRKAWAGAKRRGKLDALVVPVSIRHTMAKWLRQSGVEPWQVSAQMGHSRQGSAITEIYAPSDPSYLSDSIAAIEEYFDLLQAECPRLKRYMDGLK